MKKNSKSNAQIKIYENLGWASLTTLSAAVGAIDDCIIEQPLSVPKMAMPFDVNYALKADQMLIYCLV